MGKISSNKLLKNWTALFVLIFFFFSCNKDNNALEPTVSELLVGRWQWLGDQYVVVGCDGIDTGDINTDFDYYDVTPTETTIIEIVLEETEIEYWDQALDKSVIATSNITINILSGNVYGEGLYRWIEFERIFENFNFNDIGQKETIVLLTEDRLVWLTGCGLIGGIHNFVRVNN